MVIYNCFKRDAIDVNKLSSLLLRLEPDFWAFGGSFLLLSILVIGIFFYDFPVDGGGGIYAAKSFNIFFVN